MGKFSDIEKFMKDIDSKYQKKWELEGKLSKETPNKEESLDVDLHISKNSKDNRKE